MRMPEAGPLGETFFEARDLAMVEAFLLKRPWSGWVESVVTFADHFFFGFFVVIGVSWVGASVPMPSMPKMRAEDFSRRRLRKKFVRRVPHSSARRPGRRSSLWLSCGWLRTESTEPQAPALGSGAA